MNDKQFNLLRWTPVGISTALMILITVISIKTVSKLKKATYWREHTFQVILDAQTLEDKLLDAQSGVDRYVTTGTPNLLLEYRNETKVEAQELGELSTLTRDNAEQQRRLKDLAAAVKAVFDYDNRVIAIYGQNGSKAALQVDRPTSRHIPPMDQRQSAAPNPEFHRRCRRAARRYRLTAPCPTCVSNTS